ncbi:MAG TPA: efflux transporter outer membrane subunit [Gemmatimonadaceae bacterium]|nr:efflux transporter outer membrane subunit [Gemmatimonadaceae bacterium]
MKRLWLVVPYLFATACALGPTYHRPKGASPTAYQPPAGVEDSTKATYDSLAASRDSMIHLPGDTMRGPPAGEAAGQNTAKFPALSYKLSDSAANISWFDLFQDSVLTQLVTTAVNENRDVRVAVATINEYRAALHQATGPLFPQLDLNGSTGRAKSAFGPGFVIKPYNTLQATANLSWELDFWGRLRQTREGARNDLLAQEDSRRSVVIDLVATVAVAYLHLRELDLDLEIARNTLRSNQQTLDLARQRFNRGVISELDVRQFEANVADPAAQVANYERQVRQQEDTVAFLLGHYPGPIPRGRALNEVLSQVDIPIGVPSQLLERRPDVREAEHNLVAATARVGAALDERLPKFTITGDYGYNGFDNKRWFPRGDFWNYNNNNVYQIFLGVSIPIFHGGSLAAAQDAAQARREESRYLYEKTVLDASREVDGALVEVRTDREQVIAQQTQVNALRRALQLANDRYAAGVSSYLDVLNAERSLFTAELSLTAAERQGLVGVITLYRALGGGWPVAGYKLEGNGK